MIPRQLETPHDPAAGEPEPAFNGWSNGGARLGSGGAFGRGANALLKSGRAGIRTLEGLAPLTVFKTVAFVRSATLPATMVPPAGDR